jgi:hypothetical protein
MNKISKKKKLSNNSKQVAKANINNLIELEIIRMKIHYKIFKLLKYLIKSEGYDLSLKDLQQLLLRYIMNKKADVNDKIDSSDSVYILGDSKLANKQLQNDIKFYNMSYKMYKLITDLFESSFVYACEMIDTLKREDKIDKDNKLVVIENGKDGKNPVLIYESDNLAKITDNYIKIYDNKIEMVYFSKNKYDLNNKFVFCTLLRYKYLFLDAHGSQLEYNQVIESLKDLSLDDATECFGSPFNHTFNKFCSAFDDLEKSLGSLGNFFEIKKFPTKILLINPVFDQVFIHLTIDRILDILEKYKHIVYFILPIWKGLSYKELYNSKYLIKRKTFPKGELFFYNFPSGRRYSPCDIEIILLDNTNSKHILD